MTTKHRFADAWLKKGYLYSDSNAAKVQLGWDMAMEATAGSRTVGFDDSLNNLAWDFLEFLQADGSTVSPRVFNNLKVELHKVIQKWLEEHP